MPRRRAARTAHVPSATLSFREALAALASPIALDEAERAVEDELGVAEAVLFASARGALAAAITAVADGEDVALPAYTCAAVANAVLSAGKSPVYADVDDRGLVPREAWSGAGAAIVQDTYGFQADPPGGLVVVRDSAHGPFPLRLDGAEVTIGSFEHSKWLSAGRGGLAVTGDAELAERLRRLRDGHGPAPGPLRHSLVTLATLAMGRLDFAGRRRAGRALRRVVWHLAVDRLRGQSASELSGRGVDEELLGRPDGGAARLVVSQLRQADRVAAHRRRIVTVYDRAAGLQREALPLVRYPMSAGDPDAFEAELLSAGWDVRGRWFTGPLHPRGSNLEALGYSAGAAPNAERLAATVVNLPTHPLVTTSDADRLVRTALDAGARPL